MRYNTVADFPGYSKIPQQPKEYSRSMTNKELETYHAIEREREKFLKIVYGVLMRVPKRLFTPSYVKRVLKKRDPMTFYYDCSGLLRDCLRLVSRGTQIFIRL